MSREGPARRAARSRTTRWSNETRPSRRPKPRSMISTRASVAWKGNWTANGTDGPRRPQESPGDFGCAAQRAQRGCRMVRRTQAQLRGIMGAGQGRLREKLRSAEAILRQGKEGTLGRLSGYRAGDCAEKYPDRPLLVRDHSQ